MTTPVLINRHHDVNFARNGAAVNWRDEFASFSSADSQGGVRGFFEVNRTKTTIVDDSGTPRISAVVDYRTGFGISAAQTTMGNRPQWGAQSGPNSRPASIHTGSRYLKLPDAQSIPGDDFYKAALFYGANSGGSQRLIGTLSSVTTGRHLMLLSSTGNLRATIGTNGGAEVNPEVPFPDNTWCLGIVSWNATDKKARVRLLYSGYDLTAEATNASVSVGSDSQYMGEGGSSLRIALAVIGNVAILDQANSEQRRLLRDLIDYCKDRYGRLF